MARHRPRSRLALLAVGLACALVESAPAARSAPAAGPTGGEAPLPALGVLVAQTFLRAVADGDLRTALPLAAETVDFDGELAKGAAAVRARLEAIRRRVREGLTLSRIVVMRLERARRLFGPPPARLRLPKGQELLVGFGRFQRGGLIVFVAPERDRYRVVALTD